MDNLETLNALLDMTKEAEEMASDVEKSERLRSLVVEIQKQGKGRVQQVERRSKNRNTLCTVHD